MHNRLEEHVGGGSRTLLATSGSKFPNQNYQEAENTSYSLGAAKSSLEASTGILSCTATNFLERSNIDSGCEASGNVSINLIMDIPHVAVVRHYVFVPCLLGFLTGSPI